MNNNQIMDIFADPIKKQIGFDEVKLIFEGAIARTYLLEGAEGNRRFLKVQDANS